MKKVTSLILLMFCCVLWVAELTGQNLNESFAGTTFPPDGWVKYRGTNNLGTVQDWVRYTTSPRTSPACASVNYENVTGGLAEDWLVTPKLAISAGDNTLSFWIRDQFTTNYGSVLYIKVSTNSQTTHADFTDVTNYPEPSTTYVQKIVDLSAYNGQNIFVAFVWVNDDGDRLYLDDVVGPAIYVAPVPPNCATIVSPVNAATGISKYASLNWATGGGSPTGYKLYFGTDNPPTNIINGNDLGLVTTYSPVMDYSTTYYWQVIPYNIYGDAAGCSVLGFTTMADPTISTFPYSENFDGTWTGSPAAPTNWTVINANSDGYFWKQANTYITPTHSLPYAAHGMGNTNDWLITPPFNLTGINTLIKWWDKVESASYPNKYKVLVSTTTPAIASFTNELGDFNCINTAWTEHTLDLSAFTGQTVYVAFYQYYSQSTFYGFGIDDFSISEKPTSGTLAGTAYDVNNMPLEGVLVTADLAKAFTTTDVNGDYTLELPVGTYDVVFSKVGYSSQTVVGIDILGGETTSQDAILEELAGSNCSNAIVVGDFPYEALDQTNCGYGNFYSETCLGLYDDGEDILYQFTLTSTKDVVITVNPNGTQWAGILLASDCPPVNCVDFKTNGSATTPMVISKRLEAGTYYVMVDTWPTPNCIPSFDLTITAQDPPPPGKLTGLVFDENGNRLPGAEVTLGNAKEVAYTNALGRYTFFPVEPGLYDVSFEKANYITQLIENVEVEPAGTTELNVNMALVPAPDCPTLVYPAVDQTVLPNISLQWAPGGNNAATGYKLYLYNVTSDIWIEENTDLGNVTSYTPAEPFESGSYFAWLLVPYNFSGETLGCEPWFFYVSYYGQLTGVITDNSTGLPVENAAIFVQQTLPGNYSTTIYTDATGTYNFDWESGNYNLTISKYGYASKTLSNVPINPNQTTVMNTTLNPVVPYTIPFVENWGSGTFAAQQWTVVPSSPQWSVQSTVGNPAPTARFYWDPRVYNYSRRLQSHFINGVGKDKIYAQFDLLLQNYSKLTIEKLIFGVYDGTQWHVVNTFNNQGAGTGSIPWTNFSYDISQFAAGKMFQLGFTAEGGDNYNIDWWYVDNIYLTTSLMEVQPPVISDQLSTTGTSQWPITISNPGAKALFWNATLNLPQPWATLSALSGVVSAGGQQVIQLNFNGAAVPPGVYQGQVVITGASGAVSEVIDIQLEVFDMVINPMAIYDEMQVGETSVWNIELTNPGPYPLPWSAAFTDKSGWASLDKSAGEIPVGATEVLQLTLDATALVSGFYETEILFTGANGLISKTVDVSIDVYDMMVSPGGLYDALLVGESSTYQVVITNPNSIAIDWIVDLNETWASLSAISGTIPPLGSTTLDFTFNATGMLPGAYYSSMTFSAFDGELEKVVLIGLEVFDQPFQKIPIPAPNSWGYISTYLNLDSKMTLEAALANINEEMIIMIGFDGIYWPSQNINTIGNWDNLVGYKLKMGAEGLLVFTGPEIENKTITFPAGTYLIPVLSNSAVPAASIFGGKDIEFAFGLDGAIWWPFGNVYTLETLYPGYGYLVKFNSTTTLNFNVTKSEIIPNSVAVFENTTPWNDAYNTGNVHIVGVSAEAASTLKAGDFIGVFNAEGSCTGLTRFSGKNEAFVIPVYGNDLTTDNLDGMKEGEFMEVRIFSSNEVIVAEPVFSTQLVNTDLYATNGLSLITDLKAGATGVGGNSGNALRIYPNPSNGLFNITGADASYNVTVMNSQGQVVYNSKLNAGRIDLTDQPSGVYFIRLVGNDQTITQKVVIR